MKIASIYNKKVMQHFRNPKFCKEMKNPDAVGEVGNVKCGDVMRVYLKVKNNKIADISFQTYGCTAAIATSDVLCKLAKGKTLEKAMKITNKDIVKYFGNLPLVKMHCSVLGMQTLHKAIEDYKAKQMKILLSNELISCPTK